MKKAAFALIISLQIVSASGCIYSNNYDENGQEMNEEQVKEAIDDIRESVAGQISHTPETTKRHTPAQIKTQQEMAERLIILQTAIKKLYSGFAKTNLEKWRKSILRPMIRAQWLRMDGKNAVLSMLSILCCFPLPHSAPARTHKSK